MKKTIVMSSVRPGNKLDYGRKDPDANKVMRVVKMVSYFFLIVAVVLLIVAAL